MKEGIYIAFLTIATLSCGNSSENQEVTNKAQMDSSVAGSLYVKPDTAEYAIPLGDAVRFARIYKANFGAACPGLQRIKAYTIRSTTLLQAMGIDPKVANPTYTFVRAYIGQDQDQSYKMMIVPVKGVDIDHNIPGTDVYPDGYFIEGPNTHSGNDTVQNGPYVYDLLFPCPNKCPKPNIILPDL